MDLLLRKGVYPYEYMSNWTRLDDQQLPPRDQFFNKLRDCECSQADYDHAQRVWTAFNCRTMRDYHDIYLKSDVLQLADIFESFRNLGMKEYKLDPAHYVSSPQLSWDAMLLKTEVELELLSDPEMFRMLDAGLRGGICVISKRHAHANNPYMKSLYNPEEPTRYAYFNYIFTQYFYFLLFQFKIIASFAYYLYSHMQLHHVPGRQQPVRVGDEPANAVSWISLDAGARVAGYRVAVPRR